MSSNIREESNVKSKADLPPPRDKQGLRPVSPPLSNVSLSRFNYYVALFAALLFAFYAWRLTVWKAEAGGWWNLALGKRPPMAQGNAGGVGAAGIPSPSVSSGHRGDMTVEDRINELASALGVPSKDLASAIAVAVHDFVPPATLSSVAAHQTGEAVQYLVDPSGASEVDASSTGAIPVATKGLKAAELALEAAIGMDEPPTEMA